METLSREEGTLWDRRKQTLHSNLQVQAVKSFLN